MTHALDQDSIAKIERYTPEERLRYLVKEVVSQQQIWILTDQDGCVMLNTEDEDCAPVWPNKEFAQSWATGEWQDCEPKAISLDKWYASWTSGLEEDDVFIAVFPNQDEEGLIISPQELDYELKQKAKKTN
ncbi:DUF2750 domain-containing protein [Paraglaciecola sp. L1A13]|uniref:DUF2750 domain-containing protein n=1 Tax=Paraglaciecola sp. L1A13 TaxID=2686359 RepID=UPI00131E56CA|nr:DUF2750 domain-containing protein [Paraglaciecola sp. L1A13]|tara:strand:- start:5761 stop:6153 length:393 start_codon:yes stop_codon:yes gene_type:complete